MIDDCSALILSGGESRRMGQDKAALLLHEKPLLEHVTAALRPIFNQTIVSVRKIRDDCAHRQVCDDPAHAGPLAGLAAGLTDAKTGWVFAVACDMPFIDAALIERMAGLRDGYDAVVPVAAGHPQPLMAFYATRCLEQVRQILDGSGPHSLRALLKRLRVRYVQLKADSGCCFDLDTPEDLELAINIKKAQPWNT